VIQRLDRDGDGRISRQGFDGPSDGFSRADRNHDGYLSAEEARSLPAPPGGRP
jgi:Ca2+-binding EF-hand superfamily protein